MNRYSFSQRIALACSILLLAPTIESRAATIGVLQLSDGRQLANMSLLDPAMGAARNALTADGHTVSAIAAINAASLSGVRVLWLPLLETEAFYGQAERDALRGFYNGGGRIVWIGDAGIYNVGDDSFLSAFGSAKLPGTFDTSEPTLTA
ncbi:MAG TPA: hypothetical protein VNT79_04435, partial [Phycisphaerae bacterium]|nr:hypothetical protein [Phycisphaerae bacterium]